MVLMVVVLLVLRTTLGAVLPPRWADPGRNPCALLPGGWQLLYWPDNGRCYHIFSQGTEGPCPDTMELAPGPAGEAECRCPPGTALSHPNSPCYPLFTQGPCLNGSYFAPVADNKGAPYSSKRWGICQEVEACGKPDHLFWPQNKQCYKEFTRGPCPKGELLVRGTSRELPQCRCEASGQLAQHYWPSGQSCHEHYIRGPCLERGNLFLPGGTCGCNQELPHYHAETKQCYQLGGSEPCPPGHQFLVPAGRHHGTCICKEGHLLWSKDGSCYRQYTQGPCGKGHLLLNSTTCIPLPCRQGRLYFPENNSCYKVGMRGPCPSGQIVLFENSVRPSVDGISYRGMCGCPDPSNCQNVVNKDDDNMTDECDSKAGLVKWNEMCYTLYSQGPCSDYQWLVPQREGKLLWNEYGWRRKPTKAKCECRPGYKQIRANNGSEEFFYVPDANDTELFPFKHPSREARPGQDRNPQTWAQPDNDISI